MKNFLIDSCKKINIELNDYQANQFLLYKEILKDWNKKINLTSITDDKDIILKHFVDSLTILTQKDLKNKNVIDVGTGAGFPGIPVKIASPETKITLLDSLNKRINFLEEVCLKLNLENVLCIHSRAEDAGNDENLREKHDYCLSRAVANLAVLCEYCLPFVKVGGEFISLKGPDAQNELKNAEKSIYVLGGEVVDIKNVDIPYTDLKHNIIFIKKIKQTPSKYPRKAGKAIKSPII